MFTSGAQTPRADLPANLQVGYRSLKAEADSLRSKGVQVIAVGCCGASRAELLDIAGDDRYILMTSSAADLQARTGQIVSLATSG